VRRVLNCLNAGAILVIAGCAARDKPSAPPPARFQLSAIHTWRLNPPEGRRFDASGLLQTSPGQLVTVSDRSPTLYRIVQDPGTTVATLTPLTNGIPEAQFRPVITGKSGRLDIEGIGEDAHGRLYLCEEETRSILRLDLQSGQVERLNIDWSPVQKYFGASDHNASFEGIAIGADHLFVANERQQGRIIVVDLGSLKVVDDFVLRSSVKSLWGSQYSDLAWFRGELYVLMREDHVILRVDPRSHAVLAEYDFRDLELAPKNEYRRDYWFTGVMEGLAVDNHYFWLITDNNGLGRKQEPADIRPTLFQCRRPDAR